MATVTEPITLDKSINTTENPSRNIADVLAEELAGIAGAITTAENVENILTDMATTKTAPTISGTAVFDTVDGNLVKALKVAVTPSQDLHGYSKPWVGGAGKNKFDSSLFNNYTETIIYTSYSVPNGTYIMNSYDFPFDATTANVFFLNGSVTTGANTTNNGVYINRPISITVSDGYYTVAYRSTGVNTNDPKNFNWQIELGSTATDYEPYSNICPISGHTQEVISVKDSTDTTQATYTIPLGQTVYGGTLDVLTGELAITYISIGASDFTNFYGTSTSAGGLHYAQIDSTGAKLNGDGICNIAEVNNAGAWSSTIPVAQISANQAERIRFYCECTSMNEFLSQYSNLQIVFELETPTTVQLTPQTVKSLVGENHIQASTGDVLQCKYSMLINGDDLAILLS